MVYFERNIIPEKIVLFLSIKISNRSFHENAWKYTFEALKLTLNKYISFIFNTILKNKKVCWKSRVKRAMLKLTLNKYISFIFNKILKNKKVCWKSHVIIFFKCYNLG